MTTPLRKIRQFEGLTLVQITKGTGIDTGNLSRLERGLQSASADVATKLSKFFRGRLTELEVLYPARYSAKNRKRT